MPESSVTLTQKQSTTINISNGKNKFCSIYWDIENVSVQNNESAVQLIKLVRDKVIKNKRLIEIEFVAVCGKGKLDLTLHNQIKASGVTVNDDVGYEKNAADWKIIEYISRFVKTYGPGCSLVLISGDSDFVKTLIRSKIKFKVKIYLIHCYHHQSDSLDAVADELYLFMDNGLRNVTKACDVAVINVKPSPDFNSLTIKDDLKSMFDDQRVTKESIYFDDRDKENNDQCIWIGFPSKEAASNVEHDYKKQTDHNPLLSDLKYKQYPPYHVSKYLIEHTIGSVREETLNTLRLLNTRLLGSSQASLTPSTLSLTFKTIPAYLIVTGFPPNCSPYQRRHYLSQLLGKSFYSFNSTPDYVWCEVNQRYRAKEFIDKINDSNYNGSKLSATVEKQLPDHRVVFEQSTDDESNRCELVSSYCSELCAFVLIVAIIIIVIIWAKL